MTSERRPIVVGIDGSAGTQAAVEWGAAEARSRAMPLRLVYALGRALTTEAVRMYGHLPNPELGAVRTKAVELLATSAERAATLAPDVEISTELTEEDAARSLLAESGRATTLVLGSRGLGKFGSVTLGSVGVAVSARASCPVVVLRGPAGSIEERAGVIVGVDASESAQPALGYAFDFAARHSLPLRAIMCWHPDVLAEMMWRSEPPPPPRAEALLSEAMAGWREQYPEVDAHATVIRDHPVGGLLASSAAEYLLVVGTRGRNAIVGTLLGSVSQGVLHHATCPVAVVPVTDG